MPKSVKEVVVIAVALFIYGSVFLENLYYCEQLKLNEDPKVLIIPEWIAGGYRGKARGFFNTAQAYLFYNKDDANAILYFSETLERDSTYPATYWFLGRAYGNLGMFNESKKCLETAFELYRIQDSLVNHQNEHLIKEMKNLYKDIQALKYAMEQTQYDTNEFSPTVVGSYK